ncbi:MAG: chemotaxis protein CheW [bacterium]|nr:chemotaxis protein CheW [bacterium]
MTKTEDFFEATEGKLLTFQLGEQHYGVRIDQAREVVGLMAIDPVPQTPDYLLGVMNLRGKIVPVMSLRRKLGMEDAEVTGETCTVVATLNGEETGIVVDFLVGVVTVSPEQFQSDMNLGDHIDTSVLYGMAKMPDRVIAILELNALLEKLDEHHSA